MSLTQTYKQIYDLCLRLKNLNYGYLSLILISAICKDCTKYPYMLKTLSQTNLICKFKKIVKDFNI